MALYTFSWRSIDEEIDARKERKAKKEHKDTEGRKQTKEDNHKMISHQNSTASNNIIHQVFLRFPELLSSPRHHRLGLPPRPSSFRSLVHLVLHSRSPHTVLSVLVYMVLLCWEGVCFSEEEVLSWYSRLGVMWMVRSGSSLASEARLESWTSNSCL